MNRCVGRLLPIAAIAVFLWRCDSDIGGLPPSTGGLPTAITDTVAFVADTNAVRAILDSNGMTLQSVYYLLFDSTVTAVANSRLTKLNLMNFGIKKLPAQLGVLTGLQFLGLNNNSLRSLPAEIGNLTKLATLEFSNNRIQNLPAQVCLCTALRIVYASNDSLLSLPDSIGRCTRLKQLELGNDQLVALPASITRLDSVVISVRNNKLCSAVDTTTGRWLDAHAVEGSGWKTLQRCVTP